MITTDFADASTTAHLFPSGHHRVSVGEMLGTISRADAPALISVVIPVHDGARFLAEAVASVLAQDYAPIEIIVVDDGSTDDLARAVADLPVDVTYLNQSQRGPASARNTGIAVARGDFVAFLDVDDLWPPGALRELFGGIVSHECEVVAGWTQMAAYDESTGRRLRSAIPRHRFLVRAVKKSRDRRNG